MSHPPCIRSFPFWRSDQPGLGGKKSEENLITEPPAGHWINVAYTIFHMLPTSLIRTIATPKMMNERSERFPNFPKSHSWDSNQGVNLDLSDSKIH